jgi:hypothetical protein
LNHQRERAPSLGFQRTPFLAVMSLFTDISSEMLYTVLPIFFVGLNPIPWCDARGSFGWHALGMIRGDRLSTAKAFRQTSLSAAPTVQGVCKSGGALRYGEVILNWGK